MKQEELFFLQALADTLHPEQNNMPTAPLDTSAWEYAASQVLNLARQHKILPPIYEFLCKYDIQIPSAQLPAIAMELKTYVLSCYQMEYLTNYLCTLFDKEKLPYVLLKGSVLSHLYPKIEYRRYGDVDIFINDKPSFQKAVDLLKQHGFRQVPSTGDHHLEFELTKYGTKYTLELHNHATNSHGHLPLYDTINDLYDHIPLDKPLSPTYEAFYLLLHMLNHLLSSGFGIKLFCDWVVYLETHTASIDSQELKRILDSLQLTTFAWSVTVFCTRYLGLTYVPECLSYELPQAKTEEILETLATDVFDGGEYGSADSSRMIIMESSSHLTDYLKELHRQTMVNYPSAGKIIPLLPLLWLITGIRFLYNNHRIRHASTRQIILTARKRQNLLKTLKIKL